MPRFVPTLRFPHANNHASWFPGHMEAFMSQLSNILIDIDMVIECRDARIPLTSINPRLEDAVTKAWGPDWQDASAGGPREKGRNRQRLVVYTKRDLAEKRFEEPLKHAFWKHAKQKIMFCDSKDPDDPKKVLRKAVQFAKINQATLLDMKVLVVGMPNVGKSSLLNSLRNAGLKKGRHFIQSTTAGQTRKISGSLRISKDPGILVHDAPGTMPPWLGKGDEANDKALKIALTGGIKQALYLEETLAEYLLFKLNLRAAESDAAPMGHPDRVIPFHYGLPYSLDLHTPTNDIDVFLTHLAKRIGALRTGGIPYLPRAAAFFIHQYRRGKLGRYTLDDLEQKEDLYADPDFSFYPEEEGKPSRDDLHEKKHIQLLIGEPKTEGGHIKFDPEQPAWAPPQETRDQAAFNLVKFAPPIQIPTGIEAKVEEAVRRYFHGKEARDAAISRTAEKKLISEAKKDRQRLQAKAFILERQRKVGLAQRKMKHRPGWERKAAIGKEQVRLLEEERRSGTSTRGLVQRPKKVQLFVEDAEDKVASSPREGTRGRIRPAVVSALRSGTAVSSSH